jgi:hypothetical protein
MLSTRHGRKTDQADALSVGIAAHTATRLNAAVVDEAIATLRCLTEHRDGLGVFLAVQNLGRADKFASVFGLFVTASSSSRSSGRRAAGRLDTASTSRRTGWDVHRFRALVQEADTATGDEAQKLLRRALTQWHGDVPLACLGDVPLARTVAPVLGEERLSALQRRIALDLDAGRHRESVGELLALTSTHPYRESAHGLLMRALHAADRSAEAVAAYHAFERSLERDLGPQPGTEPRRLHQRILRGDAAAVPAGVDAGPPGIERIDDVGQVTDLLWSLARDAREVLAAHPDRQAPLNVLPYYLSELGRGRTTWRTIVHRRGLSRPEQIRYSTLLHRAGDRHRVTDRPVQRMVLLDRRVAFVPSSPGQPDSGALVIRNAAVAATLADLFEHTWANTIDIEPAVTGAARP